MQKRDERTVFVSLKGEDLGEVHCFQHLGVDVALDETLRAEVSVKMKVRSWMH